MDRERWVSFPAATDDERRLVELLAEEGRPVVRTLRVEGLAGPGTIEATLSLVVEEPFDGKASVGCRVDLARPLGAGETFAGDPWQPALDHLAGAERRARERLTTGA